MSASDEDRSQAQSPGPPPSDGHDAGGPTAPAHSPQLLFECPVFRIESSAHGGPAPWRPHEPDRAYYVIRAPDWVNVVALTPADELVLVRQWRIGVQRPTLEVPGGVIDPEETPLEAAIRELREETGFAAAHWHTLGVVDPNPALQSNRCHVLLALSAERVSHPHFDGDEHCETTLMPFPRVLEQIAAGEMSHALAIAAVQFESLRRSGFLREGPRVSPKRRR